ncbi:peptide-methionine (S)-S-oxide reductase [Candidatus Roizmanbacteria bacterium CG10_big_fil_rev_8_21_14_0_10_39_6]|uniref:Peptide methionine sulfoxide reductase MsrA n=1 Tax=Candidatus Roizmanbacteria bacterium CG10_big_fil_rev_8_21_14_0_10_39_6 TaxID=1974853 RepID=A0A2M8KS26_9BACT|nr:MAG: peptide-methionine (S)-S-oxide reductase [Candidatus Roizmanbacteria bacterium CG10_big_fil_rev_8_21_14_0_10_39_6]
MNKEVAIFGAGCFWCAEVLFSRLKGVISVSPGYAGGESIDPTYEQICSKDTGHAEVIRIEFDSISMRYKNLLDIFFHIHNPTTKSRQGNDIGSQYRSIILYTSTAQEKKARKTVENLNKAEFSRRIVTEIKPLIQFYEAEDYHKRYYEKNSYQPYCQLTISPKIVLLHKKYSHLYKTSK